MIELGKTQELQVVRLTSVGVFLNTSEAKGKDDVLLPKNQVPAGLKVGDKIRVFVYRDSEDRTIATTKQPKLTLGELSVLRVVETSKIGAFLDWGLEKDLFLPFKEQKGKVSKDRPYLVGLYVDKSNRLCATMDIYSLLSSESTYKENDIVHGTVYNINKSLGVFVAVDKKYHGLIPKKEFYGQYSYGDTVEARVKRVRKDGKLELTLRKETFGRMDKDVEKILNKVRAGGGKLSLNDNSPPSKIYAELNMSKSAFKRAAGRLMKNKRIKMTDKGIELLKRY